VDLASVLERAMMRLWAIAVVGVDLLPLVGVAEVALGDRHERLARPNDVHDVARSQVCWSFARRSRWRSLGAWVQGSSALIRLGPHHDRRIARKGGSGGSH